ncbi:MAG: molybdopterin-dependent oxidoreductase [Candidatus Hydrogenedentes bacterium]|nr:molybdopterin-dependent oxidoreductase [Candidatus Hydrogenedentota bacterium]
MEWSRREFIRHSANLAALAALGVTGVQPASGAVSTALPDGLEWHKAPCRFCGTGCGVLVGVSGGRVVAIQGDPESPVNKGLLCAKGYHVGAILYGEDRLTQPMIRKGGKLQPASWDEAIELIADRFMADPKRFAFYGSGQWTIVEGFQALKFMKAGLGSNHIDPNARLCMASAAFGFVTTFGVDEPSGCYDDLDECDTVITWGNNWAEMHPVLFSRFMDRKNALPERLQSGLQYIDLATRKTRSTVSADYYMEFVPQTDLAIANCICYQLLENGTYDQAFVDQHTRFKANDGADMTLEEYRAFLQPYSPEAVSKLSGVSVAHLTHLGKIFGDPERKIMSLWCMGMNQHTRGTWINNLVYNCHLLSGKIGKPGSTPFSLTGQPSACGTCREVGTFAHGLPAGRLVTEPKHREECETLWNIAPGSLNAEPGFHTMQMFQAFAAGELTGMWVQVSNPAQSMPNLHKNLAQAGERFLVVSDVYPTVTSALADVVLPSSLWTEKNGVYGNSERRTHQWFGIVAPPGEARDDAWQTLAVARRMYEKGFAGMKDKNGEFLFTLRDEAGQEVEAWKWEVYNKSFNVDRAVYEQYRQFTLHKHKDVAPYDELVKARGMRWPVAQDDKGVWRETTRRFVEGEDVFVKPGSGIQFYGAKAGDDRAIIWARPYEAPPEIPDTEYPFWLCTGRVLEHWHTGTMTGRIPELRRAVPKAYVELHPLDARDLGVRDGEMVRVTSRRGAITLPAWVGGRGTPARGSVFVPFFDESKLINEVTLDEYCPISKQPDYKKCSVRLEKTA